jgi:hypothetical protein
MRRRGDSQSVQNHEDRGRQFATENDVHSGRWKKTELAMIHEAEGLTKQTTYLKQKNER